MKCLFSITIVIIFLMFIEACNKEYSFEGGGVIPPFIDSTSTDTTVTDTTITISTDSSYTDPYPATANTWHFTDSLSGRYFSGVFNVSNVQSTFNDSLLYVLGWESAISNDTAFAIIMYFNSGKLSPGIYPCNLLTNNTIGLEASNNPIYNVRGYGGIFNTTPSYITITSYNTTTKNLTGSFHCWGTNYHAIYNPTLISGSFNCTIE